MTDGQYMERLVAPPGLAGSDPPTTTAAATVRRTPMSERDMDILRSLRERIDPDDAGAHNNLGVVFFQKGLIPDAVAAFERALELDPGLDATRLNARIACVETGHYRRRVLELEDRLARSPGDGDARHALAGIHLLAGQPAIAAEAWEALLKSAPESLAYHLGLAQAEAERGHAERAVAVLDRAMKLAPTDPGPVVRAGEILADLGDLEAAEARARRALELDSTVGRGYALLARVLDAAERKAEARAVRAEAGSRGIEIGPASSHLSLERYRSAASARHNRADTEPVEAALGQFARASHLRRAGDLDGAARQLERVEADSADAFEIRLALAEIRLLQGEYEQAATLYDELVEARDDSPKIWNERGVAFHRLGRVDHAIDSYRRAVALDHTYMLGWNNLGVARVQNGDEGAGERALRHAAGSDAPPEVLRNLALYLLRTEQAGEAVDVSQAAVDQDPAVARSWGRLGSALFQAKRSPEARDALLRALELDPEDAEARYQLGFVLSALGDFQGALRETKRALDLDPVFPAPRYRLLIDVEFEEGAVAAPEKDVPQRVIPGMAIPSFEFEPEALERAFAALTQPAPAKPDDLDPLLAQAREALRRGQLRRAEEALGRATALAPSDPDTLLLQGEVFLRAGFAGEALERYEAVRRLDPDRGEAGVGAARALLLLGRENEAVPVARAAARAGGGADASEVLGRCLLNLGDSAGAVGAFQDAARQGEAPVTTLTGFGEAVLADGRPADAIRIFQATLGRTSGAVAARVGLGRALEAMGRTVEAEAEYRAAVRALPSYAPGVYGLADLLWRDGRGRDALQTLVDYLALDPTDVEALVRMGRWLLEGGRRDQAESALLRALRFQPDHEAAAAELRRVREGSTG
jgi:cellulose synthase operon protein C